MWQDVVLSVGNIVFAIALIPSILSKDKPALSTSLMTGTTLGVFTLCFASLGLWYTFTASGVTTGLWYILALQKGLQR